MANKSLVILPEAEHDLTQTYTWYEEQEIGLGEEFLRCVDACLQLIQRQPRMVQIIHENYRRAIVRRFPYVIFYEDLETEILIYAVFHPTIYFSLL